MTPVTVARVYKPACYEMMVGKVCYAIHYPWIALSIWIEQKLRLKLIRKLPEGHLFIVKSERKLYVEIKSHLHNRIYSKKHFNKIS